MNRRKAVEALYEYAQRGETATDSIQPILARKDEIDAVIDAALDNWSLGRIALVDAAILRTATYELMATETPTAVILNEAIELAKELSTEQSSGFVNGVLAAIAKAMR